MSGADAIVNVLSQWLARHVGDQELRAVLAASDTGALAPEQAEAVDFLLADLGAVAPRAQLEVSVRETLEELALAG